MASKQAELELLLVNQHLIVLANLVKYGLTQKTSIIIILEVRID